ncbi:MAG TPA: glutamine ABC transporter ATP-binding protein [Erysipelotrichaceae bacterium]|nr:glutamine ABC transporter ATP-binding protein [Erysipelotrichaceae bacterium]
MKIVTENLTHIYDGKEVIKDINLSVEGVEAIALIGPSGAGKSTLLRLLCKIEEASVGNLFVNDVSVHDVEAKEYYKKVGFVFQSHNLFPHLSAIENITLVLEKVHKYSKDEAIKKANLLLEQFGLSEHSHKRPSQLSGGQAQRVSIVRSLAIEPEVLFLDEPTSALDPILTREVLRTILELRNQHKKFIIVTHELGFAKKAADYVIYMEDGVVIEEGKVDILDHPKTNKLRQFVEYVMD